MLAYRSGTVRSGVGFLRFLFGLAVCGVVGTILLAGIGAAVGGRARPAGSSGPAKPADVARTPSAAADTPTAKPTRSSGRLDRVAFRSLVIGKSRDEVRAAIGKPNSTLGIGGTDAWEYTRRTVDPVTNKIDDVAQVIFDESQTATDVNFLGH